MTGRAISTVRAALGRLVRDDRGVSLVLIAIGLSVLIGFAGLGAETGLWYAIKRQNQSAADMGAVSGAFELAAGKSYSDICSLAANAAVQNGFTFQPFTCPASSPGCTNPGAGQMCANNPPVLASYPGDPVVGDINSVEVILSQQQSTLFARQNPDPTNLGVNLTNVTINTRGVATVQAAGAACGLALGPNQDIKFNGNPSVCFGTSVGSPPTCSPTCGIASDSSSPTSVDFTGISAVSAAFFTTVGNYNATGNVNISTVDTNSAAVSDPFSCYPPQIGCAGPINYTLPAASAAITTNGSQVSSGTVLLQPGLYSNSSKTSNEPMSFTGGTGVLCPGVYYLDGEGNSGAAFSVKNGAMVRNGGTADGCSSNGGVTIIATCRTGTCGGGFSINGNSGTLTCNGVSNLAVCLSASTGSTPSGCTTVSPYPTSCIPSGVLFYQVAAPTADTANKGATTINDLVSLTGDIYIPSQSVTFQGNANATCTVIIASSIQWGGTTTMSASQSACSAAGVTAPELIKIVISG